MVSSHTCFVHKPVAVGCPLYLSRFRVDFGLFCEQPHKEKSHEPPRKKKKHAKPTYMPGEIAMTLPRQQVKPF